MADRSMRFGGGSTAAEKLAGRMPDTITSKDTVEVLLGISEGPIRGLVNGPKSFYADDTALVNADDSPNFTNFQLDTWPGDEAGPPILMALGGFASPTTIGVTLAQGTSVVRPGSQTRVDAIDYRVVIQQLMKQTKKGVFATPLQLKFEYKRLSSSTWLPAWAIDEIAPVPPSPIVNGEDTSWVQYGNENLNAYTFLEDRALYTTNNTVPTNTPDDHNAVTFDVVGHRAYVYDATDTLWHEAALDDHGLFWTFTDAFDNSWRIYKQTTLNPEDQRTGDLWVNSSTALLVYNGGAWVMGNSSVSVLPSTDLVDGVWTINAKVSSPTPKDIRIYVDPIDEVYEFRVTKLSADSGVDEDDEDLEIFSVIQWESIQEIVRRPWSFTGLALAKIIGQASDQFSSMPAWTGDYYGRIVKVPSNYDEDARTYAGIWDGTYRLAWTNNPAFILQDFVENERYGLSSVYRHTVNKWKFYEFGQYCDEPIARPDGSFRPRWTFTDYVTQPRDAKEMAQYIAGAAGALYVDDGNGGVDLVIDKDGPSIAIFSPENIGEDGFSYSYTDRTARPNQVIVEFFNFELNRPDKRIIRDEDDITAFGLVSENFIAVGCTDVDEAIARARRRLIGGLTERELVTFTTNRKGKFLSEWEVILCADPDMGRGLSGRIHAVTGNRSVSLRDPITFEAAIQYVALFDQVNPAYEPSNGEPPYITVTRNITNGAGTTTSLSFSTNLPELPEYANFVIQAEGIAGFPKPFRISGFTDEDGTGENIRVTALELNRNKWAFIDTGVDQGEVNYDDHSGLVLPATDLIGDISYRPKGNVTTRVLTLRWTKSKTTSVMNYRVTHIRDSAVVASIDTNTMTAEFEGIDRGFHTFSVVAVTMDGKVSAPAYYYYDLDGIQTLSPIKNLRLLNGATEDTFETISPQFAWDPIVDEPNFDHYEILVYAANGTDILRTQNVGVSLDYTYGLTNNAADHGVEPDRTFMFGVRAIDNAGVASVPAQIEVTNPPPPAPQGLHVGVQIGGFLIKWKAQTSIPDFGGTRIYMSQTPGGEALPENLVADVTSTEAVIMLPDVGSWQILVGHYDLYRPSETVFADEVASDVAVLIADLADALENATDAGNTVREVVAGITEEAEALAQTVIADAMRTATEIQQRELENYIQGVKVGTLLIETMLQTDDLLEFSTLLGAFNGPDRSAVILHRDKVMYDDEQTLAEHDDLIEAKFSGGADSYLLQTLTAAASAAGASTTALQLLGAKNPTGTAFVLNTGTAMVGAQTLAQYISSVSTTAANGARADATAALNALSPTSGVPTATYLASVKTDIGISQSNVSFLLSSIGGNQAMAVLSLDVNGRNTGFMVNGVTQAFGVMAQRFYIADPSDPNNVKLPFLFESGIAYLEQVVTKYLKADSIYTEHLQVGATGSTVYATGGGVSMSSGSASLVYAGIVPQGRMVQVLFYSSLTVPSSRTHIYLQLTRNGSAIGLPQHISLDGEDSVPCTINFTDVLAPDGAGCTYEVIRTSGECSFDASSLTLSNLKRFG